ncbi:GNAT family N-acetyltransferase [Niveispirillum fermenti]|uniref:GNAT family N-acetyltransferase n=1 Tax=Niveispirillum fermenti TaxID=1233113 RepID=UPI003A89AA50
MMGGFQGTLPLLGGLSLRHPRPADDDFLLELFMDARPWLGQAHHDRDFIRMLYEQQYSAMRTGQETRYPQHLDFVVEKLGQPVGRIVMDLGRYDWRVAEVEIHRLARGKGVGTNLLRSLQGTAMQLRLPMTLSVNQAETRVHWFYYRLGFELLSQAPPMLELVWLPPGHPGIRHLPPQIMPSGVGQGGLA